jgi:hypothetical protein
MRRMVDDRPEACRGKRLWQYAIALSLLLSFQAVSQVIPEGLTDEQTAIVEQLVRDVSMIRGLEVREPLRVGVMSVEGLQEILLEQLELEFPPERLEGLAIATATLGLLPPGHDVIANLEALLTEQIGGLYDDEEKRLCLMEWINLGSQTARMILAHEITHALQDQHFDIFHSPLHDRTNDDRGLATLAVLEGDAMVTMGEYAATNVSLGFFLEAAQLMSMDQTALTSTPRFLQGQLLFPYLAGQTFAMHARWGPGESFFINDLMREWPESTEQILHSERSLIHPVTLDHPTSVEVHAEAWGMPEDWRRIESNTLGEFTIQQVFEAPLGMRGAQHAAAGWDGDRWEIWRDDETGAAALLWSTVWDTEADAEEFAAALDPLWEEIVLTEVTDHESAPAYREPRTASALHGATVHVAVWDAADDLEISLPDEEIERRN